MGRCFITAPGKVKPDNPMRRKNPQRIQPLRRKIDSPTSIFYFLVFFRTDIPFSASPKILTLTTCPKGPILDILTLLSAKSRKDQERRSERLFGGRCVTNFHFRAKCFSFPFLLPNLSTLKFNFVKKKEKH